MSLPELQAAFHALVTAPDDVATTLARRGQDARAADALVVGDARRDAVGRLDVYANMYFFRILDVLREFFPRTADALGAPRFHNLVTGYLAACPPAHPSLGRVGERFAGYVATVTAAQALPPWLAELAAVEWAHVDTFDAADAVALDEATLRDLAPAALAQVPLGAIPAHALIPTRWDVLARWGPTPSEPEPSRGAVLVWRPALQVRHVALAPADAWLVGQLVAGTTLDALCTAAAAEAIVDDVVPWVVAGLRRWCAAGLVVAAYGKTL